VTILAPSKADLAAIQEKLQRRGIKSANIRDEDFSFSAEGMVRLSTLHSSKGLDFPVGAAVHAEPADGRGVRREGFREPRSQPDPGGVLCLMKFRIDIPIFHDS